MHGCAKKAVKDEIVMWLVGSEPQAKSVNELGAEFTKQTGISVRCEAISWGEAHSKYLTAIAGKVAPDIGTMGLTWGSEFGKLGAMIDLREAYTDDIAAIEKETFKGLWDSIRYRYHIYGVPFDMTMHIMYYRTDIIPKAPETWDELKVLLKKLNAEGKGMLFDWGSLSWIGYSPFLWQAEGSYYNETYAESMLDREEAVQAMKFFTELYNVYNVPKTSIPLEQGMRTGDFPICISGNWKIIGLTIGAPEIKGKWAISTLPKGPTGKWTAFMGGRMMGIFNQSKNKDKAWQFIKFLYKPESQAYLYKKALETQDAYLPPNTDTWHTLDMEENMKKVLLTQAHDAKGPPAVIGWDGVTRYIDEAIQKIVLKGAKPEDELRSVKARLDEELKKEN